MSDESSLDKMWQLVESFGLKRVELDPRGSLSHEQVRDLYLIIKHTHKKRTKEQIKLLKEALEKEEKQSSKKLNYQPTGNGKKNNSRGNNPKKKYD